MKGKQTEGKIVKKMDIVNDGKQFRVGIPEYINEIFGIDPKKDKFNWYVKRIKGNRVRLMAILSKGGRSNETYLKLENEKDTDKELMGL